MTSIEDHEICIVRDISHKKAKRSQKFGHTCRVVNVHLAAISLDVDALSHVPRRFCGEVRLRHPAAACGIAPGSALANGERAAAPGGSGIGCGRPHNALATPPAIRA